MSQDLVIEYNGQTYLVSTNFEGGVIKPNSKARIYEYAKGGGVGKAVSENFSEEELIQIASDYAYVISGNEERATYQLLDKDYTHTLLPKYISAIKKFESKYNKPVRAKGKMYKDMYPNIGND